MAYSSSPRMNHRRRRSRSSVGLEEALAAGRQARRTPGRPRWRSTRGAAATTADTRGEAAATSAGRRRRALVGSSSSSGAGRSTASCTGAEIQQQRVRIEMQQRCRRVDGVVPGRGAPAAALAQCAWRSCSSGASRSTTLRVGERRREPADGSRRSRAGHGLRGGAGEGKDVEEERGPAEAAGEE
jgi:hypothetical protein